ncbi:MAG: glycoside hydrolase family protein [Allomuricauda sp.]
MKIDLRQFKIFLLKMYVKFINEKLVWSLLVLTFATACQTTRTSTSSQIVTSNVDDLTFKENIESITKENIFRSQDYYNWGSSIIKGKDGLYHLFYSRWKREYGFYAWLTHSEVAHAVSKNPYGPWEYKETALQGRGGNRWDAITAHNPKIKYFEGKYFLYYIGTHLSGKSYTEADLIQTAKVGYSHPNWKILRPNQRTGVAVASSLNGPWKRVENPIIEPSGPITTLTVNPAIAQSADGSYYLIVKGDKPNEKRFIRNQAIAISKTPVGPFEIQEKPVIDYLDTEDMSMWYDTKRNRFYGIYHAHSYLGLITSKNGLDWEPAVEKEVMVKSIPQKNGSSIKPDRMERPFIYVDENMPKVLSLAVKKGNDSYIITAPINVE